MQSDASRPKKPSDIGCTRITVQVVLEPRDHEGSLRCAFTARAAAGSSVVAVKSF